MDTRVQSRGISLVSGCHCCRDRSEETLFHLFILSEVARQVWKFFANFSKLPSEYSLILQALNIWMVGSSTTSQYEIVKRACSAYIFREIWVSRCSATYDDGHMSARTICVKMLNRICTLNLVVSPKRGSTEPQFCMIEQMEITKQPTWLKRGIWYKWDRPSPGWFKLNVDGSARDDFTIGGGGYTR